MNTRSPITVGDGVSSWGTRSLVFDGATLDEDAGVVTITITGGGVTDHAALTSLTWAASAHTGTPSRLAAFDSGGAAGYASISAPLLLSGGALSIPAASGSVDGYLQSSDWTVFNNKVGTARTISTTAPLTGGGDLSANRTIAIPAASGAANGYLSSSDWTAFNGKVATTRTISTTAPLSGGGDLSANRTLTIGYTAPIVLSGSDLTVQAGSTAQIGALYLATDGAATAGRACAADDSRLVGVGSGTDDDPTKSYTISITPSGATLFSRDNGVTVRSAVAGNTTQYRTTLLSGAIADFYTTNFYAIQTGWNYTGYVSFKVRLITGSSVASPCRMKMAICSAGITAIDTEPAGAILGMFRFIAALGDVNWMCYQSNAAGSNITNSGIAVTANTEYLLEIRVTSTNFVYLINGSTVATVTTNLPPTTTPLGFQCGNYTGGKSTHYRCKDESTMGVKKIVDTEAVRAAAADLAADTAEVWIDPRGIRRRITGSMHYPPDSGGAGWVQFGGDVSLTYLYHELPERGWTRPTTAKV